MKKQKLLILLTSLALVLFVVGGTLANETPIPIAHAAATGLVSFVSRATDSLSEAEISVHNHTDHDLFLVIPAGSVLASEDRSVQSLGVIKDTTARVPARSTKTILVPVVCIDMELDQPNSSSVFASEATRLPTLARLAATASFQSASSWRVQQFAVWIAISDPAPDELPGLSWASDDDFAILTLLLGIDDTEIATLMLFPGLALMMSNEELALWQQAFTLLNLPTIQNSVDLAVLFAYGGPTSAELAEVRNILENAGFTPTQFKIFAPTPTDNSDDNDGFESPKPVT